VGRGVTRGRPLQINPNSMISTRYLNSIDIQQAHAAPRRTGRISMSVGSNLVAPIGIRSAVICLATASQRFQTHSVSLAIARRCSHRTVQPSAGSRRQSSRRMLATTLEHARSLPLKYIFCRQEILHVCSLTCLLRFLPNNQQPRQQSLFSSHTVFHFPTSWHDASVRPETCLFEATRQPLLVWRNRTFPAGL
jgi:hypothetical protein